MQGSKHSKTPCAYIEEPESNTSGSQMGFFFSLFYDPSAVPTASFTQEFCVLRIATASPRLLKLEGQLCSNYLQATNEMPCFDGRLK